MRLETINRPILIVDLDDTVISVKREGSHNRVGYYSWTTFSSTEGVDPEWSSELVRLDELFSRIDSISHQLTVENQFAINKFFKIEA